jgi:plasmid stabilization system protein ParE
MILRFADPALSQAEHIDTWWRANRPDARTAFAEDFAAVIAKLQRMPLIRPPHDNHPDGVVRRWLLPRTGHHVYYTVNESAGVVRVLSVWGGPRGSAPPLP